MSSNRTNGGIIGPNNSASSSSASGIWSLQEQRDAEMGDNWPTLGIDWGSVAIGTAIEGGYFAGLISTAGNGVADYALIVAPKASGEDSSKQWKTSNTSTSGTTSVIDGPTNSSNMNDANHPAAQFCEGLTIGGYSDWYMPAKDELEICYYNLKPDTTSNYTGSGSNAYSVPARGSNYTSGTPAETSVTDFQAGNSEAFNHSGIPNMYWVSTEYSSSWAWRIGFDTGEHYNGSNKDVSRPVRAVRRVAI